MDNETRAAELSGIRRAAILICLMGEEVAGQMFQHLTKREIAQIAKEVAEIGPIDPDTAREVLEQYYIAALNGPEEYGGPDTARRMLAQASISEDIVDKLIFHDDDEGPNEALGPLLEAPPPVLARALQDEHPQTTALVLLHLPPNRAGQLLASLPEDAQPQTVLRMATLRQVPGEVLGEVATSLHERLSALRGRDAGDGLERTVTVLQNMARTDSRRVLEQMEVEHPDHVERLRDKLFTFDTLVMADDRGMQELLRQVDSAKLGLALVGAGPELQERFLGNLSERAASMLREEMEFLGEPDAAEQKIIRKEILEAALKLESDGNLVFRQPAPREVPDE